MASVYSKYSQCRFYTHSFQPNCIYICHFGGIPPLKKTPAAPLGMSARESALASELLLAGSAATELRAQGAILGDELLQLAEHAAGVEERLVSAETLSGDLAEACSTLEKIVAAEEAVRGGGVVRVVGVVVRVVGVEKIVAAEEAVRVPQTRPCFAVRVSQNPL
jgi:hypothetical protein